MRKVASSFKYKMAQAICFLVRKTDLYTYIYTKPVHKIAKAKGIGLELNRFLTEAGKEKSGGKNPKLNFFVFKETDPFV